jgi:hypothetical protein
MSLNIRISDSHGDALRVVEIDTGAPAALVGNLVELKAAPTEPRLEWSGNLCDGQRVDYATAEKACAALGEGWRLPTRQELESILDLSRHNPAADPERFPDMKSDWYWSSTPCAWSSARAWCVGFSGGDVYNLHRDVSSAFARAVRAVPSGQ